MHTEICPYCEGHGTVMVGKLYPLGHTEVDEECELCCGLGEIEVEDVFYEIYY
jgi:DnaJ-class molecular chaperone